jgi:hypothetical protein
MAGGYIGKILRVNLTTKEISTIDTARYEEFGGGYGMGTAIFWDLAVAPGEWDLKDPYDPRNVLRGYRSSRRGKNQHLRAISGDVSYLRVLAGQFRRPVWHHDEACRLGRSCGGRQG